MAALAAASCRARLTPNFTSLFLLLVLVYTMTDLLELLAGTPGHPDAKVLVVLVVLVEHFRLTVRTRERPEGLHTLEVFRVLGGRLLAARTMSTPAQHTRT